MELTLHEEQEKIRRSKLLKVKVFFLIIVLLLIINALMADKHIKTIYRHWLEEQHTFYVFKPEAYKLLALNFDDLASRFNLLYALYSPVNTNIPSIDFKRLTASLRGSNRLDYRNSATYLTVAHYWSWVKKEEGCLLLADFQKEGVEVFPENWEIPYSIYSLVNKFDKDTAMHYIQMAAQRAGEYGGPLWIVDFPAVLMHKDGESIEAFLWLQETYAITRSSAQQELVIEQMKKIEQDYSGEYKSAMQQIIAELEQNHPGLKDKDKNE